MIPDFPIDIRIRLAELKFFLLLPDFANFLPCWPAQFLYHKYPSIGSIFCLYDLYYSIRSTNVSHSLILIRFLSYLTNFWGDHSSWGPNFLGTKFPGDQISRGPNFLGTKFLGDQISRGPNFWHSCRIMD